MFIAQILHIPGAEQCRCPEKFIEIFGFSESRRNFGHFGFDTRTVGQAAAAGVVCIPQVWGDARFAELARVRILHAPARVFELRLLLLLACRLLACRECLASFLFKSPPCPACVWAVPGPYPPPPVVADQLNWANPKSWMAQLDQSSLDHHLLLIPLIEAIVAFKNFCSTMILGNMARSRSQN